MKKPIRTKIMGILNTTPDSFYDQGQFQATEKAIAQGINMIKNGVDIIDIGGESTRPGAKPVSEEKELERVLPVIEALRSESDTPLSIDTMKPKVALAAVKAGVSLINDVTGFRDPEMIAVAAETEAQICVMHMLGEPRTMQINPCYSNGVIHDVKHWLLERVDHLEKHGVSKEKIILDPGVGFGKTVDDNYQILHNLKEFKAMGFPVLIGHSRKSFMTKVLGKPPSKILAPTIALSTLMMMENVDFIRVHDVEEHTTVRQLMKYYQKEKNRST